MKEEEEEKQVNLECMISKNEVSDFKSDELENEEGGSLIDCKSDETYIENKPTKKVKSSTRKCNKNSVNTGRRKSNRDGSSEETTNNLACESGQDQQQQLQTYKCETCSFSTRRKYDLKFHINSVHKKIKPFMCHVCSYASSNKAVLNNHIRWVKVYILYLFII